ncbi:MAG: dNTP triphosphohydrolase [Acidobacteriaceae bacterium]|nr:dNTP triphosphohydrolase [Acidobacteriaceae bacterium]
MLSSVAVAGSKNDSLTLRVYPETEHAYRSAFQRDRDRVVHSRAFRRLAGKTQVFTRRASDHFRSRLTHTIEVSQIARTVALALGLNEELAETLALVHDIGHPPFGHAGERALDGALQAHGLRFDHNLHALRIVEHFEQRYAAFRGLNLTLGVREGIVKHSRDYRASEHPELAEYLLDQRPPLEAQIIDLADEIAYLTADLDDGVESGLLEIGGIRANVRIFERYYAEMERRHPEAAEKLLFAEALKRMLNALVVDLIEAVRGALAENGVRTLEAARRFPRRLAVFSPDIEEERRQAKKFLYAALYQNAVLVRDQEEAAEIVRSLFEHWVRQPGLLPAAHQALLQEENAARIVADYIAGMTDEFILEQYVLQLGN